MSLESVDVVLNGYRAFIDGDFETVSELLADQVEWNGIGATAWAPADRSQVLRLLAERLAGGYRVTLDRCIGLGDQAVVHFRAAKLEPDPTDDRPLQSRRSYTIGRYSGVVTVRDGKVVRIEDYPHIRAALEAVGLESEFV